MALDLGLRAKSALGIPARPTSDALCNDLARLAPAFGMRVAILLDRMVASGHTPLVWETYRTPERAAALAAKGVGVVGSMHCYGCAVDIVRKQAPHWDAPFAFWRDLRDHAELLGLVSGARFKRRHDAPHVQCVPATAAAQNIVRDLFRTHGQDAVNLHVRTAFADAEATS